MKIDGNARAGEIELRSDDLGLDEIVAENAFVHLERMSDDSFSLLIETRKQRGCFFVRRKRTPIMATTVFIEAARKPKRKKKKLASADLREGR